MKQLRCFISTLAILLAFCANTAWAQPQLKPGPVLIRDGGNLDWSHTQDLVAYDKMREDGYYDLFVMRPSGIPSVCLSCRNPRLPGRNIGQPLWTPSGRFLVCQVQKEDHPWTPFGFVAQPTAGVFSDLWYVNYETRNAQPLHVVPEGKDYGTLRPVWSLDGKTLFWTQMYDRPSLFNDGQEVGYWDLMRGDVRETTAALSLSNVRKIKRPAEAFYQFHSVLPDGRPLVCGNFARRDITVFASNDIGVLDLETETLTPLTQSGYNEHAFPTPDGKHIVWAHGEGEAAEGTDYWVMDLDGSNKRRLTFFNDPKHPQYNGKPFVACDLAWGPDGTTVVAYCHDGWDGWEKTGERIMQMTWVPDTEESQ